MKSKFLSFLIIIAMLLGMVPNVGMVTAYGETSPSQVIEVRVEGPDGALYDTSVTVTGETNGLELLESAVGAENILGYTSDYGYFLTGMVDGEGTAISGIAGEAWSTSWGVYEKRGGEIESAATGLDGVSLGGLEELLIHYKAYDSITYADLTFIPRVSARQSGLDLTITVNKEISVWGEDPIQEPMAGAVVKIGETEYTADENGVVTPDLAFGSYEAFVYKEGSDYPELIRSEITLVLDDGSGTGDETPDEPETSIFEGMTNREVIEQVVTEMRSVYGMDTAFSFREALGYLNSGSSEDWPVIADKIVLREMINQATDLAANILSIYAAGMEPADYEGINHLQRLIEAQQENGVFEVGGEGIFATQLAWSMAALDLTGGVYDVASATSALISLQNEDGGYGSIDFTAMAIPALVNHSSEPGAAEALDEALSYLTNNKESILSSANQYTLSAVVNGLCAAGENPLADEWSNGDETLLSRLMHFYKEGTFGNASADEQVFLALSDLYSGQSVFSGQEIGNINFNELFIPANGQSGGDDSADSQLKASLSVKGLNGSTILSAASSDFESGDTVLDFTKMVLTENDISYDASSGYMAAIDGLAEFDNGVQSGWMYKVNGNFPDYGADSVNVEDGDNIVWVYTSNMGTDVGDNSSASGNIQDGGPLENAKKILEDSDSTLDEIVDAFNALMEEEGEDAADTLLLLAEAAIEKSGQVSLQMDEGEPADMDASDLEDLAEAAVDKASDLSDEFDDEGIALDKALESRVVIKVEGDGDLASVEFEAGALGGAFDEGLDEVDVVTPWAEIALGADTLGAEDMDKEVVVEVRPVDESNLPEGADVPNGATVIDMNLFVQGEKVSNFKGTMKVSIPFEYDGDNGGAITVYWLKDDGSLVPVGGAYNEESGMIVFETNHFSKYFVDESEVAFEDMELAAWAEDQVSAMAGKGFINGRGPGRFDPSNDIIRAEFAAIVTRMLSLTASNDYTAEFADVSDADWFSGSVAAASEAGLMNGKGGGMFDPDGKITRQEQAVVLSNVLESYGYADGAADLDDVFSDSASIAGWAEGGAASAVHHGLINGIDGRFAPTECASRAQSAVMLYRLYFKIIK